MRRFSALALAGAGLIGGVVPAALADIDPVRVTVSAPAKVYVGSKATIRVTVDADKGAFAGSSAPIRVRARLARNCGSSYEGTTGRTVVDAALNPQPSSGSTLHAVATGKPKLTKRGTNSLCVFVTDAEERQFAEDTDSTITVKKRPAKR